MHTSFVVLCEEKTKLVNRKYKDKPRRFVALICLLEMIIEDTRIKGLVDSTPAIQHRYEHLKVRKDRLWNKCGELC